MWVCCDALKDRNRSLLESFVLPHPASSFGTAHVKCLRGATPAQSHLFPKIGLAAQYRQDSTVDYCLGNAAYTVVSPQLSASISSSHRFKPLVSWLRVEAAAGAKVMLRVQATV